MIGKREKGSTDGEFFAGEGFHGDAAAHGGEKFPQILHSHCKLMNLPRFLAILLIFILLPIDEEIVKSENARLVIGTVGCIL